MGHFARLMIVFLVAGVFVSAEAEKKPHPAEDKIVIISSTEKPTTTTSVPNVTTSVPLTTTTAKPEPPTTTTTAKPETPKTTTTPPTSTTVKPTPAPSTTPQPITSSTTTPAPSSTTTSKPEPADNTWVVIDGNEKCILAKMNITLRINYNSTKPKDLHFYNGLEGLSVGGSCSNETQTLVLAEGMNSIKFEFSLRNASPKQYYVSRIDVQVDPKTLNMTQNDMINMDYVGEGFLAQVNNSYECSSPSPFKLNNSLQWEHSELMIIDVTLEAFRGENNGTSFSSPINCVMVVSDIVPIVVGCILALLVVFTLGGYLYGRKRNLSRGYTSM